MTNTVACLAPEVTPESPSQVRGLGPGPALGAMARLDELSPPMTQKHDERTPAGAIHGLEKSAQRLERLALRERIPLPGCSRSSAADRDRRRWRAAGIDCRQPHEPFRA